MRMNGWQRVGLALSIAWAIGAGVHTRNADVELAQTLAKFDYERCTSDFSSCNREREREIETWMQGSAGKVAFAALAPIPFGWLAAFILLYFGRAQIIGFRAVVPWATLSSPRKAFVVFCAGASLASVLLWLLHIMSLYVDKEVPVVLSPLHVMKGDGLV